MKLLVNHNPKRLNQNFQCEKILLTEDKPHEIVKSALKIQKVCISMREREFQCSCAC